MWFEDILRFFFFMLVLKYFTSSNFAACYTITVLYKAPLSHFWWLYGWNKRKPSKLIWRSSVYLHLPHRRNISWPWNHNAAHQKTVVIPFLKGDNVLCLDFSLHKCDPGFGTDHCVAWVMKSIPVLCCRLCSNLVACVKRKHAFSRVLCWSQICHSERKALIFIFVKAKSLSGKSAALEDISAFHLDFSGEKDMKNKGS